MFKGIYTPMVTIFDDKGSVNKEATRILIEKLISNGIDGIVALGSTGEFFSMSLEQRKDYVKFVCEVIAGRVKFIVGTGSNNIEEVLELNKFAESIGADAVLIVTPYYFSLNDQHLYEYYSITARNTKLPILLYNFPDRTGTNLSPDLVFKLAVDFDNIVGIKDTIDSISNVRKYSEKFKNSQSGFSIFSGFEEYLIPNLLSQGSGIIGGLTNINARIFIDAYKAFQKKDVDKLMICQGKINKLMGIYNLMDPFMITLKEAVGMRLNININTSLKNYSIEADENIKNKIREFINIK
ncbi:dihydrodipicolinate synthase family protein [Clostridium sp. HV4-5-A1G]|uniref:dihydrodipicolinate synthase family protein n=1 Tax=Clostridium sp. HV4-5-A1G TaxID=2004595 RepID=UPI001238EA52|nr:dihydrodipicolinate synthase family protein [Clostridium sp. HV4-5-A1G]KAA8674967.1 dihydrodipicolinate synthase family protein [Clostridium sp. HV4-5-A1G]